MVVYFCHILLLVFGAKGGKKLVWRGENIENSGLDFGAIRQNLAPKRVRLFVLSPRQTSFFDFSPLTFNPKNLITSPDEI